MYWSSSVSYSNTSSLREFGARPCISNIDFEPVSAGRKGYENRSSMEFQASLYLTNVFIKNLVATQHTFQGKLLPKPTVHN